MSNFPQTGPFGGPFPYHGSHSQYGPPQPPSNIPYNVVLQQPYPQARPPIYGQPVPQNGHMIQYPNTGSFHNNAHYAPQGPNPSLPPQALSQPYYGYGQYTNGIPPPPYTTPAPLPTYYSAAPPPSSNHSFIQPAQPPSIPALPKTNANFDPSTLSGETTHPQTLGNGIPHTLEARNDLESHGSQAEAIVLPPRVPSVKIPLVDKPGTAQEVDTAQASARPTPGRQSANGALPKGTTDTHRESIVGVTSGAPSKDTAPVNRSAYEGNGMPPVGIRSVIANVSRSADLCYTSQRSISHDSRFPII